MFAEEGEGWRAKPISVTFEIPYFTVSGIQVEFLFFLPTVLLSDARFALGPLPQDSGEEWVSSPALGAVHHSKRRVSTPDELIF